MLKFSKFLTILFYSVTSICFASNADSTSIPIVFIHKNNPDYLKDTLWQAKHFNQRVILIGDTTNNGYSDIEHYYIAHYSKGAQSFADIYTHLNGYPYDFSLINFQRWFILQEFMEVHKIPVCFYCDSDQMLYCNITQEYENFKHYDMSVISVGYHGGMASYWTPQALSALCKTLQDFYADKEKIAQLVKEFKEGTIKQWYADDCPHFTDFVNDNHDKLKIGILNSIIDGGIFDPIVWYDFYYDSSLKQSFKFKMKDIVIDNKPYTYKDIQWLHGHPHCYNQGLDTLIRFKAIHFQGIFKALINNYRSDR